MNVSTHYVRLTAVADEPILLIFDGG